MPVLSRFLGLLIKMEYLDHPPPHFHVYQGKKKLASINIKKLELLVGKLPRPQLAAVLAWAHMHQRELLAAWDRTSTGQDPGVIRPL
jgi:uncharacterized protein DUF4160